MIDEESVYDHSVDVAARSAVDAQEWVLGQVTYAIDPEQPEQPKDQGERYVSVRFGDDRLGCLTMKADDIM